MKERGSKSVRTLVISPKLAQVPPRTDAKLVQIVDAAFADAAQRSGDHLKCRPGCTQCCVGVFAISQLDAARLTVGMRDLKKRNPERASRVRQRAEESIRRTAEEFPGNRCTGILAEDPQSQRAFDDFANDEPCPALDPNTGLCDLYSSRPMTCRVFGPPVRTEGGLGVCELCFTDANEEEVARCEMIADPDGLEDRLLKKLQESEGKRGQTIVAYALLR
ncbi:MAG TPA: YkgJ family cysteine cluster protein [Candidatus Acidoferrales bacterium]|nr:YkgJ family cysteine cluster protein [Candidatus Acidoferrales bacterium]